MDEEKSTAQQSYSGSLSETLKQGRESKGLELSDIASLTNVRKDFLLALEENRYEDLPESIFVRNFARLYSQAVGLDDKKILEMYNRERGEPQKVSVQATATTANYVEQDDNRRLLTWLPAIVLIAVLLGLSYWLVNRFLLTNNQPVITNSVSTPSVPNSNTDADIPTDPSSSTDSATSDTPQGVTDANASVNLLAVPATTEVTNSDTENSSAELAASTQESESVNAETNDLSAANSLETVLLSVVTNPPGASVSIDDYDFSDTTPILEEPVTLSNSRQLIISLNGYETRTETLDLTQEVSYSFDLTPESVTETSEAVEADTASTTLEGEIALNIEDITWVEVYQSTARGEGERLVYTTLQPGDSFVFQLPVFVHVGNAGGVRVSLNGQDRGFIGSAGEVVSQAFNNDGPIILAPEDSEETN